MFCYDILFAVLFITLFAEYTQTVVRQYQAKQTSPSDVRDRSDRKV